MYTPAAPAMLILAPSRQVSWNPDRSFTSFNIMYFSFIKYKRRRQATPQGFFSFSLSFFFFWPIPFCLGIFILKANMELFKDCIRKFITASFNATYRRLKLNGIYVVGTYTKMIRCLMRWVGKLTCNFIGIPRCLMKQRHPTTPLTSTQQSFPAQPSHHSEPIPLPYLG